MSLSSSDFTFLNVALNEAEKSTVMNRHGAVAVINGKVMGRGCNSYRTSSSDGFIHNCCTCHAEVAALRDLYKNCTGGKEKYSYLCWNQSKVAKVANCYPFGNNYVKVV